MNDENCKMPFGNNLSDGETVYKVKVNFDDRTIVNQVKCCIEKNILKTIDTASER